MRDDDTAVIDREVGRRIKLRRLELRISQSGLAKTLNVTFQQVQKYETGRNRVSASSLSVIAKTLRVNPAHFFDFESATVCSGVTDRETVALNVAFTRITDTALRTKIVEMIEAVAAREMAQSAGAVS